ncbi:IclR family transcriptional regulator [Rhodococcus sp. NPDC056960]|uniref:IclR family transcriptional regulator n=1 Tax=Rhodococcus sp. NPDC056960 TaxID=3345982 RepID=UPI0036391133
MTTEAAIAATLSSAGKTLALLRAISESPRTPVRPGDLSTYTQLPRSTVFRLLAVLEQEGWILRDRAGIELNPVAATRWAQARSWHYRQLREALTPYLVDLYAQTRLTIHLGVLEGPQVLYLNKLHGHSHIQVPTWIGATLPAERCALGKALLAHTPSSAKSVRPVPSAKAPMDLAEMALEAELRAIRRTGLAHDHGSIEPDLMCVAVPILAGNSVPVAGISLSMRRSQPGLQQSVVALRRVAGEASARFSVHSDAS